MGSSNLSQAAQRQLFLPGPAGEMEAILNPMPDKATARRAVLICHPHPLYGGTMQNKILHRIAKRLPQEAGSVALRFNFRGVGKSEGSYDGGRGESGDVQAALDWLAARYPHSALTFLGYSFGAAVGLQAAAWDHRVSALVGLGLPLSEEWDLSHLRAVRVPWLLIHGENDEFTAPEALERFVSELPRPPTLRVIPGANHLFHGCEDDAVDAVIAFLAEN
jgi:alpha/beta superfamily hydrolase